MKMKNKLTFDGDVVTMEVMRKSTGEIFNVKFSKEQLPIVEKHYWSMTPKSHCIHCNYKENGKLLGPTLHKVLFGFKFVTYRNGDKLDYTNGNVIYSEKSGPKNTIGHHLKGNEFFELDDGSVIFKAKDRIGRVVGKFIVDKEDVNIVTQYTWNVLRNGYIHAKTRGGRLNSENIYLHRLITGAEKSESVDHINGDKSDNRRSNLRICSLSQNIHNQGLRKNNSSGYKGISLTKSNTWEVQLQIENKPHRKIFKTFQEAIDQYNAWKNQFNPSGLPKCH